MYIIPTLLFYNSVDILFRQRFVDLYINLMLNKLRWIENRKYSVFLELNNKYHSRKWKISNQEEWTK